MPPIHIGDSWTFDLQGSVMPLVSSLNAEVVIGTVPAENYHGILTGRIRWTRPASGPIDLQLEMDMDGYSTLSPFEILPGGDEPGGFDSNIYPRYRIQTDESP